MAQKSEKNRKNGKAGVIISAVVVLILIGLIVYRTQMLKDIYDQKQEQLDRINQQIIEAREETSDIEDELIYRQTDDFIEDEARELGLRYPDEIIIVPKEDQK